MSAMRGSCSVCGDAFDVQFRYQMEETRRHVRSDAAAWSTPDGAFAFYCSQKCHAAALRGESGAVVCDACHGSFKLDLVAQVLTIRGARKYACGEACRTQVLAEANGVRLGQLSVAPPTTAADAEEYPVPLVLRVPSAAPVSSLQAKPEPPAPATMTAVAAAPAPPRPATRRLAIFNHKGGTGKTTTSVQLAAAFAAKGLRVLLVDTDSQGNVAVSLGVKAERSLYHVLVMGLSPKEATINVRPNLDLIVSNETLAAAELYLAGRQNRDRVLRERLARVDGDYDMIVLDCSPSLSLMNQNALVASDGIVVPVACDYLSLVGVRQVIKTVKNVNSLLRHPVQITGVLPTFYDARARICRDALETLRDHFGTRCFEPIRMATKIKEAPAQGKTVFEHAPDSTAAEDYAKVAARLLADTALDEATSRVPLAANG